VPFGPGAGAAAVLAREPIAWRLTLASRSRHTGGVQSLLCDGSVRFISDNIDKATWRRLGSSEDGLTVSDF
jgi:prepilin-type processing-associated H-X9-DG protein